MKDSTKNLSTTLSFENLRDFITLQKGHPNSEWKSFSLYKEGLKEQFRGNYAIAFENYISALEIEVDQISRAFIYYNLAIIYSKLNLPKKALLSYSTSLSLNPLNTSAMNNAAVLYLKFGELLLKKGLVDESNMFFSRAAQYWSEAVELAPGQYLEAENWLDQFLRSNGRSFEHKR